MKISRKTTEIIIIMVVHEIQKRIASVLYSVIIGSLLIAQHPVVEKLTINSLYEW